MGMKAMTGARNILRIELLGNEFEDGRILFKSPDLEGFYFVVNAGEDPFTVMKEPLMQFIALYLNAEGRVRKIEPLQTPREYRQKMLGMFDIMSRPYRDYSVVAEVA